MKKSELLKSINAYLDTDDYARTILSKSQWEQLIDAFLDYTPLFIDNLFEDIPEGDFIAIEDRVQEFVEDVVFNQDSGIDFKNNPPFSESYFIQYLARPDALVRPLDRKPSPAKTTAVKPEPKPQPQPEVKPEPEVKKAPIIEPTIEPEPKESYEPDPELALEDSNPIEVTEVPPHVELEPEHDSLEIEQPVDNTPEMSPGEATIRAARMETTDEYLKRRDELDEESITKSFKSFETLYKNQMSIILSTKSEMERLNIVYLGLNITDFKFDEVQENVRRMLIDGFLDRYNAQIDSGEFDPRDYVMWSDLDATMVEIPEPFNNLIENDLREMMQAVFDEYQL